MMDAVLRIWSGGSLALLLAGMVLWLRTPLEGRAVVALHTGLVLLLVMPVLKLVAVLIDEIRAREWGFAALGIVVLLLLGASVILASR